MQRRNFIQVVIGSLGSVFAFVAGPSLKASGTPTEAIRAKQIALAKQMAKLTEPRPFMQGLDPNRDLGDYWSPPAFTEGLTAEEAFYVGDDYRAYTERFQHLRAKGFGTRWYYFSGSCSVASAPMLKRMACDYGCKIRIQNDQPENMVSLSVMILGPLDSRFEQAAFDEPFKRRPEAEEYWNLMTGQRTHAESHSSWYRSSNT
jgi:hypothetical protein